MFQVDCCLLIPIGWAHRSYQHVVLGNEISGGLEIHINVVRTTMEIRAKCRDLTYRTYPLQNKSSIFHSPLINVLLTSNKSCSPRTQGHFFLILFGEYISWMRTAKDTSLISIIISVRLVYLFCFVYCHVPCVLVAVHPTTQWMLNSS